MFRLVVLKQQLGGGKFRYFPPLLDFQANNQTHDSGRVGRTIFADPEHKELISI